MRFGKRAGAEPISGYRLVEFLGKGGFGEVWKCEAPGGIPKAIKFVQGDLNALDAECAAEQELTALQHIKSIRHPFFLSTERIECLDDELIIVMELADGSLQDVLVEYQAAGLPGIPRAELLAYLSDAAEALDVMNIRYDLQHLDIKPRNLFLVDDHVKVGDFGLVRRLETANSDSPLSAPPGGLTPFYAAPEVLEGAPSRQSDQYSLAIVYQELLTDTRPFAGKNLRQLLMQHVMGRPDLHPLPAPDRPVVARALAKDWRERFASCRDLVRSLTAASAASPPAVPRASPTCPQDWPTFGQDTESSAGPTLPAEAGSSSDGAASGRASPAGYRFLTCLGRSPLSELWEVETADGRERLARLVHGCVWSDDRPRREAIFQLESLEHRALPRAEVVPGDGGRLVLLMDRFEKSLRDRWAECQRSGLPGIPREELLGYLQTAAEALDCVCQRHAIQHLGLNPSELVLADGRLWVQGCGLVQLLWLPAGHSAAQLNERYAAPELFKNQGSRSCDQYSLALIYQEMLIGRHPHHGSGRRRPPGGRGAPASPDLDLLPAPDRPIIARALHANPDQRFSSCTELIRALEGMAGPRHTKADGQLPRLAPVIASPRQPSPLTGSSPLPSPIEAIAHLVQSAAGSMPIDEPTGGRPVLLPGNVMQQTYRAWLPGDVARLKLDGFCLQWKAEVVQDDDEHFILRVRPSPNRLERWKGKQAVLEVQVRLTPPRAAAEKLTDVLIQVKPLGCERALGEVLIKEVGPLLLESVSGYLQAKVEASGPARQDYAHALLVFFVCPDRTLGAAVECQGKDITLNGIRLLMPCEPPTAQAYINPTAPPDAAAVALLTKIVRAQRREDGRYEVEAVFVSAGTREGAPHRTDQAARCAGPIDRFRASTLPA